jgi:hypothetical protein
MTETGRANHKCQREVFNALGLDENFSEQDSSETERSDTAQQGAQEDGDNVLHLCISPSLLRYLA